MAQSQPDIDYFCDFVARAPIGSLRLKLYGRNCNIPFAVLAAIDDTLYQRVLGISTGTSSSGLKIFYPNDMQGLTVVLYWVFYRRIPWLPHATSESEWAYWLIHAWIVGDKLELPTFQDLVMLELLKVSCKGNFTVPLIVETIGSTVSGCVMQKFVADEVAYMLHSPETQPATVTSSDLLERVNQYLKFQPLLTAAMIKLREVGQTYLMRLPSEDSPHNERWKEFMVAGGPQKHWVHGG